MKKSRTLVYLCTILLLLTLAGCGNSNAEADVPEVYPLPVNSEDIIDANAAEDDSQSINEDSTNDQSDNSSENDSGRQNGNEDSDQHSDSSQMPADDAQQDNISFQSDNSQPQSDCELEGSIESIGNNSVVINELFTPSPGLAIAYGGSDKVLVTVYFSEETEFEIHTVKNGGVNGDADVEKQQGSFSDLTQGTNLTMTGNYDGNDFHAEHVIIYKFV